MRLYYQLLFIGYMMIAPVSAGPLLDAAEAGDSTRMEKLLALDPDVHERGQQGETALHWMAFHGNEAMVKRLIAMGADIHAQVRKGSTPLHLAAYNGHTNVAKLLIANGAKVNAPTQAGTTPLDWAKRNGHRRVEQLLVASGAKVGSSQFGGTVTTHPNEKELEDLKYFPRLKGILAKHQSEQGQVRSPSPPETSIIKKEQPDNLPQAGLFRIQLTALSSHKGAIEAWNRYRSKHPDIFGDMELIVEPVRVNEKAFYRVQTGQLTKRGAESMCNHLIRRSQPCIVINVKEY